MSYFALLISVSPLLFFASLTLLLSHNNVTTMQIELLYGAVAIFLLGAFAVYAHPLLARGLPIIGIGCVLVSVHNSLLADPSMTLIFLSGIATLLALIFNYDLPPRNGVSPQLFLRSTENELELISVLTSVITLSALVVVLLSSNRFTNYAILTAIASVGIQSGFYLADAVRSQKCSGSAYTLVLSIIAFISLLYLTDIRFAIAGYCLAILPWLVHSFIRSRGTGGMDGLLTHPAQSLVFSFFLLILAGTVLLSLPFSATSSTGISLVDAAFTATSAVCVTGLIVLDTGSDFSFFGQFIILLLIQLGGLGIMAFYAAALRLLGRRPSVHHESSLAAIAGEDNRQSIFSYVKATFLLTAFWFCLHATV